MPDLIRRIEAEIPALRRYALVLARDADAADDLVQDCLERALSRLHLWRRAGNLRAWLFTILHNVHANHLRALSRQPCLLPLEYASTAPVADADPYQRLELDETLAALWQLSSDQREVLLLVVVEGMSYRQAGAVLGVPVGTIMSRLARGRERLRELTGNTPARHLRSVK